MSSLSRTYKRAKMFSGMNKQQRELWKAQHGAKHNPEAQQRAKEILKEENNNGY